ncbi:MAG: Rrf2 family transcriptional regulator [Syntrophorhabdaceae bacterium]|nr:Rrf2 family transcriptional regulator [Syntrophorhabdaceae bacterium]
MFQISRKADYAIRGMVYLALKPQGGVASIKDIAGFAEASRAFLAKIFQQFNKMGIVKSYRGTGGGFMLGRPAGDITLLDIVEAVDGPILGNTCLLGKGTCSRDTTCPVHPVWKDVRQELRALLGRVTLERLAGAMPETPEPPGHHNKSQQ